MMKWQEPSAKGHGKRNGQFQKRLTFEHTIQCFEDGSRLKFSQAYFNREFPSHRSRDQDDVVAIREDGRSMAGETLCIFQPPDYNVRVEQNFHDLRYVNRAYSKPRSFIS